MKCVGGLKELMWKKWRHWGSNPDHVGQKPSILPLNYTAYEDAGTRTQITRLRAVRSIQLNYTPDYIII